MAVRLPRLLASDLSERGRLSPTAMDLQLDLYAPATAQITLAEEDIQPGMHDWVEIYTARGSAGIYRVTSVARTYKDSTQLTLMHAIDTLSDNVWRQRDYDYSGTVSGFLTALLAQQATAKWQLGTCADSGSYKRAGIDYTRLSDLLWELAEARHGYYLSYDFTTTPWTLNLLALPSGVSSEWRLTRNVHTLQVRKDDADLCTRLHMTVSTTTAKPVIGYDEDPSSAYTVKTTTSNVTTYNNTAAQAIYGIVEKTADLDSDDEADPAAWAQQFLADRAQPTLQIAIDGYELAAATGESLDAFTIGALSRVTIPETGEEYDERIITVRYPDVLGEPEHVAVEMANRLARFSESLASVQSTASSASSTAKTAKRGGGSSNGDQEHWAQICKKIVEANDGTGLTQMYESGIVVDATTGVKLYSIAQGFTSNYAELKVHSGEISTLVQADGEMSSRITQNANAITLKVSQGDVATQLAVECGNVTISGGNLVVSGYITSSGLSTAIANMGTVDVSALRAAGNITASGAVTGSGLYISSGGGASTSVGNAVASFGQSSASGGSITIPYTTLGGGSGSINFNIADTQYYKDGVAAVTLRSQNPYTWTTGVYLPNLGAVSSTVTAYLTNGKTPSGAVLIDVSGIPTDTYTQVNYARKGLNSYGYAQLYVYERNTYYSAGTHYWYWSSSGGWDTLYEKD